MGRSQGYLDEWFGQFGLGIDDTIVTLQESNEHIACFRQGVLLCSRRLVFMTHSRKEKKKKKEKKKTP